MCGRFTLTADPATIRAEFGVEPPADLAPRYNIAPTQPVLGVVAGNSGRKTAMLEWGLIPYWSRDRGGAHQRINARGESLMQKPMFREAFAQRRCLIIATGFFEWRKEGKHKQPVLIRMPDGKPFAFAGLWDRWFERPGEPVYSCTIVTTAASSLLHPIHDRMPVILDEREREIWLNRTSAAADLQALLHPNEASFEVIPVSELVNSPKNDVPDVLFEARIVSAEMDLFGD